MEIIYRSDDGQDFYDEEKCLKHELLTSISDTSIIFANVNCDIMSVEDTIKHSNLDQVYLVGCKSNSDYEKICYLFDYYGLREPGPYEGPGPKYWLWCDEEYDWIDLIDKINEITNTKQKYENFIKILGVK